MSRTPKGKQDAGGRDPIARLAVKLGFIGPAKRDVLLNEWRQNRDQGGDESFADLMVRRELISASQAQYLQMILKMEETRALDRRLAETAMERQWVQREVLESAAARQKEHFEANGEVLSITEFLVRDGHLSEEQRDALYPEQKRPGHQPPPSAAPPQPQSQVEQSTILPIELIVTPDKMEAYVESTAEEQLPDTVQVAQIKGLLKANGIRQGLVDDAVINEYLKNPKLQRMPFKMAQGLPPGPARDPVVRTFFDTDPFGVGKVLEGDRIDFRDRGRIPQVEEGALIAERVPGEDGPPGIDVFGDAVPGLKPPQTHHAHRRRRLPFSGWDPGLRQDQGPPGA